MAHDSTMSSLMVWESLKLQYKEEYSKAMAFRAKQHEKEIAALCTSLQHGNAKIYQSGIMSSLEEDRIKLQGQISQLEDTI